MTHSWMKEMSKFMSRSSSKPGLTALDPLQPVEISSKDFKFLSDTDLVKLLNGDGNVNGFVGLGLRQAIMSEIGSRSTERAAKPSWTGIAGLVVGGALVDGGMPCLAWLTRRPLTNMECPICPSGM